MMQENKIKDLLNKYQTGEATDEEIAFLESWYLQYNEENKADFYSDELLEDAKDVWNRLHSEKRGFKLVALWPWIATAAAACFLLFFYIVNQKATTTEKEDKFAQNQSKPIIPGSNKAILTLADGKKIILSDAGNGKFGKQGNTSIVKTANGQLIYKVEPTAGTSATKLVYNTVSTPNGGQYWIILSDGTRVFLNAGSSLRYPASFSNSERKVELTGEAYFEVVHNNAAPFRIAVGTQVIEDIGTKFNINAYDDELVMKTTLIEGAVKVSIPNSHVVLNPGQQSEVSTSDPARAIKVIEHANLDEALAWKNGLFEFNHSDIKQVMRNAARWYDFKVIYENKVPELKISGRLSRNVDFSGLIALLEFEGVKFNIAGRNVTIKN